MTRHPIAIDPPGCGCTECITGQYVPLDRATPDDLARLHAGVIANHLSEGDDYQELLDEAVVEVPARVYAGLLHQEAENQRLRELADAYKTGTEIAAIRFQARIDMLENALKASSGDVPAPRAETSAAVARTLQSALDHLRAHGWTRGRMSRDGAVCASGTIRAVTPNRPDLRVSDEERAAITALAAHVTPPYIDELPEGIVTAWNDACTSQEQVEDGFRRAITALEEV